MVYPEGSVIVAGKSNAPYSFALPLHGECGRAVGDRRLVIEKWYEPRRGGCRIPGYRFLVCNFAKRPMRNPGAQTTGEGAVRGGGSRLEGERCGWAGGRSKSGGAPPHSKTRASARFWTAPPPRRFSFSVMSGAGGRLEGSAIARRRLGRSPNRRGPWFSSRAGPPD